MKPDIFEFDQQVLIHKGSPVSPAFPSFEVSCGIGPAKISSIRGPPLRKRRGPCFNRYRRKILRQINSIPEPVGGVVLPPISSYRNVSAATCHWWMSAKASHGENLEE